MKKNRAREAIERQKKRMAAEHAWWERLDKLSKADDVPAFYKAYAEYLEWNNVISPQREIIHKMAKAVAAMKLKEEP